MRHISVFEALSSDVPLTVDEVQDGHGEVGSLVVIKTSPGAGGGPPIEEVGEITYRGWIDDGVLGPSYSAGNYAIVSMGDSQWFTIWIGETHGPRETGDRRFKENRD